MEFQLSPEQQKACDLIESTADNICLLGKPGVGKSVLIRALVENGNKTYTLAAPTGLAALNIGGKTLHSLFFLPTSRGIIAPDYNNFTSNDSVINNLKYNVKHLIIDEISMVRVDTFDYIDRMLKAIKGNEKPFGGVQIIIVGDFYQLPPIAMGNEANELKKIGYKSTFVFSSFVFPAFKIIHLNKVLRQKGDPKFLKLLDKARQSEVLGSDLLTFNKRVKPVEDLRIRLCATNAQSLEINNYFLNSLEGNTTAFESVKTGNWPALPVEEKVFLKVGAQVIVKKNGADVDKPDENYVSKVVNGTLGIVHSIEDTKVMVKLQSGDIVRIFPKQWDLKVKTYRDGRWEEIVVATFNQIPLALAWAISIHKSQGQSFDSVHIDARRVFADGQLYVALSRCRTLDGITLEHPLKPSSFTTNREVVKFFNSL